MSRVFATAKQWGYFPGDNPAIGVGLPEKKAVREKHVLLPDQIPPLLAILGEPVHTMVLLGVLTGLRIGEILGLQWRHISFASGEIRVEQACYRGLIGSPKTNSSRRTLPVPELLLMALRRLHGQSAIRSEQELVFHTRNGTPFGDTNLLHKYLKPAGRKLGMPWSAGTRSDELTPRYCNTQEVPYGTLRRSWAIRRCPLRSKSTPYPLLQPSGRRSKIFRDW